MHEFALAQGLGPRLAVLVEAAPLLAIMAFVSAWAMRRFQLCDKAGDRLVVRSVAVTLVLGSEFIGGPLIQAGGTL